MAELRIYGGIGVPDQWGNQFLHSDLVSFLDYNQDEEVTLRINSPGGMVRTGNAIVETLKNSGRKINTVGEELVGSIATVIFLTGERRSLYPTTEFFLHNTQGGVFGNADDIAAYAEEMRKYDENLINTYMARTGSDRDTLETLLKQEVFLSGREAMELGFATNIIEPVTAYIKRPNNMKLSDKIKAMFSPVNDLEYSLESGQKIQVSTGGELPKPGDGVRIDNMTAADGAYTLSDKRVFNVAAGKLVDIVNPAIEAPEAMEETEEEETAQPDRIAELEAKIAALETMLSTQTAQLKEEATDLSAAVMALVDQMRKTTSGKVKPPVMNVFPGEEQDNRSLQEKVAAVKKMAGITK